MLSKFLLVRSLFSCLRDEEPVTRFNHRHAEDMLIVSSLRSLIPVAPAG